jgi:hypothetical protein
MPSSGARKDQPDQPAPERSAGRAGRTQARGLVQLDLAVFSTLDDDSVLELDQVLLGRLDELGAHALRGVHLGIRDREQIAHVRFLSGWIKRRGDAAPSRSDAPRWRRWAQSSESDDSPRRGPLTPGPPGFATAVEDPDDRFDP